jgi:hypothetical protein
MDTFEAIMTVIGGLLATVATVLAFCFIGAFPIWLLWNWLIPVTGFAKIGFLQAFALAILGRCLTSS